MRHILRPALAAMVFAVASPAFAAADVAYVTNEQGGVSVIDLDAMKVVKEIDVGGKTPRGLGITDDGAFLITANKGTDDVSVIDTASGAVVKRIRVGKGPEFVRVRGDRVYVTFEPDSQPPVGAGGGPPPEKKEEAKPEAAKAGGKDDDDDDKLAHIAIIDVKTWKVVKSIVSGLETEGVEFSADGKNLIVTNEGDETISVYNRATGKHVKTISTRDIGKRPRGIHVTPDGKGYAVTLEGSSNLVMLNAKFEVVKTITTKTGPYGVAFNGAGNRLLVAAARASTLQVFDAKTLEQVAEAPIGMRCWHFTDTPDGSKLLIACGRSNEVRVLNAHDYKEVTVIPGFKLPWGIVTYPKGHGSLE